MKRQAYSCVTDEHDKWLLNPNCRKQTYNFLFFIGPTPKMNIHQTSHSQNRMYSCGLLHSQSCIFASTTCKSLGRSQVKFKMVWHKNMSSLACPICFPRCYRLWHSAEQASHEQRTLNGSQSRCIDTECREDDLLIQWNLSLGTSLFRGHKH